MSLPIVKPSEVGLESRRLEVADGLVRAGHEERIYSAAVLLVARSGKIAHQFAFGELRPDGPAAQINTIFDLASVSKPHTALGLLTLVEDGKIALSQEVREIIPEAKESAVGSLTIKQLATHITGLPAWKPLYKSGLADQTLPIPDPTKPPLLPNAHKLMLNDILATPLHHPPSTKYMYSDLGYMLLGEIVSRVTGVPLDQYQHARIFGPLGMTDTGYRPAPSLRSRIAATSNSALQGKSIWAGHVHDENAFVFGEVSGHAGLFGTAPDMAIAASALATNGEIQGHRLFGLPTLRLVRENQTDPAIGGHSIGWFTPPNGMLPRGDILPDSTFGHTGFTGTMVVIEPKMELVIILLTNRVINPADGGGIARIRRRLLNAVASAVAR